MSLKYLGISLLIRITLSQEIFEQCDLVQSLEANSVEYLESPAYPDKYSSDAVCRYLYMAPVDYTITAECTIDIEKDPHSCNMQFVIATDKFGNMLGENEVFCGSMNITRRSIFRSLVIAYYSLAPQLGGKGSFSCKITTEPQACNCGWPPRAFDYSMGQTMDTAIEEFPYMAALYHKPSETIFCVGTIISHHAVLTSIDCIRLHPNAAELQIIVGSRELFDYKMPWRTTYDVSRYYENPLYNQRTNESDIAMLVTMNPIEWSGGVGPICMPLDEKSKTANYDFNNANVVTWGATLFGDPIWGTLRKAYVSILPPSEKSNQCPLVLTRSSQFFTRYQEMDAPVFAAGTPVVHKGAENDFLLGITVTACYFNQAVSNRITYQMRWIGDKLPAEDNLCFKLYN